MELSTTLLDKLEPVRSLSPDRRRELAGACSLEHYAIGADPLRGVELSGQSIYLVRGELKVSLPNGCSRLLVGGCDEANWPFGKQIPMPLSSKAITAVDLVRIDNDLLDILMTWISSLQSLPSQLSAKQKMSRSGAPCPVFSRRVP